MKRTQFSLLQLFLIMTRARAVIACVIVAVCDRERAARNETRIRIKEALDRDRARIKEIETGSYEQVFKDAFLPLLRKEADEFEQRLRGDQKDSAAEAGK